MTAVSRETLSEEDLKALHRLVYDLATQDNRGTADPIFLVQHRVRHTGYDLKWGGDHTWTDVDGNEPDEKTLARLEAAETDVDDEVELEDDPNDPDDDSGGTWQKTGYEDVWETVAFFLTASAASAFVEANQHRFPRDAKETRIWADSAHRNPELKLLRRALPLLVPR